MTTVPKPDSTRMSNDTAGKYSLFDLSLRVADHVDAMLAYWDKDLVCRFANAAYLEWFGKNREEMINKITIQELLGPLFEKNRPFITAALRGERQVFERDIVTPAGGVRHSLATYVPDVSNGEVHGFFVHVADISPVKKLENQLIKTHEIVNEQNKRLLNFANIVSHNLRSYANNFQQLLELIDRTADEAEKSTLMTYLRSVSSSFTSTISGLNEIVHIQNLSNVKSQEIYFHEYVAKVVQILKPHIEAAAATVINDTDPMLSIQSNSAYMESILLNLLSNAIKYHHPSRKPVIRFNTFEDTDTVGIKVEDNGLGIDLSRFRKELFGMYKTFHSHPDAKGIGLYLTKFQVESMRGNIDVESTIDKGTTFIIRFPK